MKFKSLKNKFKILGEHNKLYKELVFINMKGFGPRNNFKENNKNSNFFENDRLINNALKLHSKGKISEAKSYYQDLIKNGISDPRVYTLSLIHI